MSSHKVNKRVGSVMSRPHQKAGLEDAEKNTDPQNQEILLAFTLTGLNRSDFFSQFFPLHRQIASRLIDYLISIDSVDKLLQISSYGRDFINPNLFNYCFGMAVLNRKDTADLLLLSPAETFPDKFFPAEVFQHAIEELTVVPEGSRKPILIDIPKMATDKYAEVRLEYFRHDLGLNVCYDFWHLTHPFEAVKREIVDLDRRGELWYYFHQQIIARYNAERYCNGLLPVVPLSNFDEPIEEGYFPKICTQYLLHSWAPRFDNSKIRDLHRPYEGLVVNKTKFQRWIDRICNAIELGNILDDKGAQIPLNNDKGVDHIGNILQSSVLSPNRTYYGDICNIGHAFIAYCHDPENMALQAYSVMGEPSTCTRDVLFYRWYAFLVRIVQNHKSQLPAYTKNQLGFDGIKISSISIENGKGGKQNQINTSWDESDFNLKNGLSFQPDGDIFVRCVHLAHEDFQYVFDIENNSSSQQTGTVRIFLSQKNNVRDRELTFEEIRMLMIELDRFPVNLPPGKNHIIRRSTESSVTIPSKNIFEPDVIRQSITSKSNVDSSYCLSGWPAHLLIPKGTKEGANFLLFAMVSKDDPVVDPSTKGSNDGTYGKCRSASSYCSLPKRKYPDSRSMGFPFDRPAALDVLSLHSYLQPNMKTLDVTIKFSDK
ncbi:phenoloxidase 2-like [Sitodiplosis mosellana]|uniref:phenoloxidase 2-like n=1 Tax=Sitodiplosis mosellana TaxID=263140 RepID=UPI0024440260|nr:phenoloxidase 2-like [Sitodiplosis mosellana]